MVILFIVLNHCFKIRFSQINHIFKHIEVFPLSSNVMTKNNSKKPIIFTLNFNEIQNIYGKSVKKDKAKFMKKENNFLYLKSKHKEKCIKKYYVLKPHKYQLNTIDCPFTEQFSTKTNRLMYIHNTLCDAIQFMNEIFAFILLMVITYIFMFIIFALFSGYW